MHTVNEQPHNNRTSPGAVSRTAICIALCSSLLAAQASTAATPRPILSGLPLNFEANIGQGGPSDVQYVANGKAYSIALAHAGATLGLGNETIQMHLLGSRSGQAPRAEQPLPGKVNYLIGNDPTKWRTDVPTFGKVRYSGVYPGVDLVYYGTQGQLEYDFAVAPGANPDRIGVRFEGAQAVTLDARGNLAVKTHRGQVAFEKPVAYQWDGARRLAVSAGYRVAGNAVRFVIGRYDHSKALIIDPVLSYSSYLGGSFSEAIGGTTGYGAAGISNFTPAAAIDSAGNLYVVGNTYSTNFPTVGGVGAATSKYLGQAHAWVFVSKIAPDASSLVYSTYIGGSFDDFGYAIAVDSAGSAYVTGTTTSADFPVTAGAFQTTCAPVGNTSTGELQNCLNPSNVNSGNAWGNAFVTKLSPAGNSLAYSSFLGTNNSVGQAIAVDGAGRAYVAGNTAADDGCAANTIWNCFPTTSGALLPDTRFWVQGSFATEDAFVTVFNAAGSALLYSTLYGDKNQSTAHPGFQTVATAVAVDAAGNFYLGGQTQDGQLPTTNGALQTVPGPSNDSNGDISGIRAFVAKFSPVGGSGAPALVYGTYLGSTIAGMADFVSGLAADASGNAFVYGWTSDTAFPVTAGAYQTTCAPNGANSCANVAYIAKLNPNGSALLWATYFGAATGSGGGIGHTGAIAIDAAGNSYITGAASYTLPLVNPIQPVSSGGNDRAFVSKFDPTGSKLLFSTLIGAGNLGSQEGSGIAVDSAGSIYVAGSTNAADITTTTGVFQPAFGGTTSTGSNSAYGGDGFVAKISALTLATTTTLSATPTSAPAGTAVAFTALVKPTSGSGVPTGNVTFGDGATALGTATLDATGQATLSTSTLTPGSYSVTAVYAGDSGDLTSTSTPVTVTISPAVVATTTTLSATPLTGAAGVTVTLTASVAPASGTGVPTGTVTFKTGSTTLGSAALNGNGKATYTASTLPVGADSVTAAYGGDATDTASSSSAVTITIAPLAPTGLTASASDGAVTLSWGSVAGATAYNVYEGTSAGGESKTATMSVLSGTTTTVPNLTNGTTYYFTVTAVASGVSSAASNEGSATPTAPVTTKSGSSGGGGGFDAVSLLLLGTLALFGGRGRRRD